MRCGRCEGYVWKLVGFVSVFAGYQEHVSTPVWSCSVSVSIVEKLRARDSSDTSISGLS